jgi:hypothetical protein
MRSYPGKSIVPSGRLTIRRQSQSWNIT